VADRGRSPNNGAICEPLPAFITADRPSRYEAAQAGFVYSSGRKTDVDTYGGTGDDRASTFVLAQREERNTEDEQANMYVLPARADKSKL
jgi:hypothetical protein